jgi:hypothetical protein
VLVVIVAVIGVIVLKLPSVTSEFGVDVVEIVAVIGVNSPAGPRMMVEGPADA